MCTNIMARGIDIRNAVFVINVVPPISKTSASNTNIMIDVDMYLHRVGRTGRHNDKGVALTIGKGEEIGKLVDSVKKVHKIGIHEMESENSLIDEVFACIQANQ